MEQSEEIEKKEVEPMTRVNSLKKVSFESRETYISTLYRLQ